MDVRDRFFGDPEHRRSEEAAVRAEMATRANRFREASEAYREAAEAELSVALRVGEDGGEPVLRGLFAVSATSLFLKASEFERAESVTRLFLEAPDLMTEEARDGLKSLIATAARGSIRE